MKNFFSSLCIIMLGAITGLYVLPGPSTKAAYPAGYCPPTVPCQRTLTVYFVDANGATATAYGDFLALDVDNTRPPLDQQLLILSRVVNGKRVVVVSFRVLNFAGAFVQ